MESSIMRDKTILTVGSKMEVLQPVRGEIKCARVPYWKRALEKSWRLLMRSGPGYRYPTKHTDQNSKDSEGEGVYIYY